MTINVQKANWKSFACDAVAFFQPEDAKWINDHMHHYGKGSDLHTTATALVEAGDMKGRKDELLVIYPTKSEAAPKRILLVGMGKPDAVTLETVRRAAARAAKKATATKSKTLALYLPRVKGAKGAEVAAADSDHPL
jgi:leucyl aminopeptidase